MKRADDQTLKALAALEVPSSSPQDSSASAHHSTSLTQQSSRPRPLGDALRDLDGGAPSAGASAGGGRAPAGGSGTYSKEEIQVLRY